MGVGIILLIVILFVGAVLVGFIYGIMSGLWFRKTSRKRDRVKNPHGDDPQNGGPPRPEHSRVSVGGDEDDDAR